MSIFGLFSGILKLYGEFWLANPVAGTLLYMYAFWVLFLACAAIYAGWRMAPLWVRIALAPVGLVAGAVDVFFEFTFANVLFLTLWPPRNEAGRICYTLTQRVSFYKNTMPNTWRGRVGRVVCRQMLDPFQTGGHCS